MLPIHAADACMHSRLCKAARCFPLRDSPLHGAVRLQYIRRSISPTSDFEIANLVHNT
jgi:hypothetical protein